MKRISLAMAVAAGAIAAFSAAAQQNPGGIAPPNREETVPLQLKAEQVAALQQKLNERGFFAGRVDGLWGPDTSAAVRSFQQKNSLPPTGQLDPGTLETLGIVDAAATSPAMVSPTAAPPATTAAPAPSGLSDTTAAPAMSGMPLGTASTGTNPAAAGADPAASTAAAPGSTPGNAVGQATDRTLGTNTTGTNPGSGNAGQSAAGSDSNQAVAMTNANAPQPAKGANSFSDGEARRRIESSGYSTVADLKKDGDGVWRGSATKDGAKVGVWLDYKGNIGQQ